MKLTYSYIFFGIFFSLVAFTIAIETHWSCFHCVVTHSFNPISIPFILSALFFSMLGIIRLMGKVDLTNINEYDAKDLIQNVYLN